MTIITDKILDANFDFYDNGYWSITEEVIISCEGHIYAKNDLENHIWFAEIHTISELECLLVVLRCENKTITQ